MTTTPDLSALPSLPRDAEGPVFREPWEAQAFALAVQLHARGLYTWTEWAAALAEQIRRAPLDGDADLGDTYYRHWLAALEALVAAKGASSVAELERYRVAWDRAADRTPHGRPIALQPQDFER
ncbi:MAG TPA: nitrile hydratase accessory protein [Caldimonas sp.]|nr:nitrile hydratase accessory protein [Caldimonas sp.]